MSDNAELPKRLDHIEHVVQALRTTLLEVRVRTLEVHQTAVEIGRDHNSCVHRIEEIIRATKDDISKRQEMLKDLEDLRTSMVDEGHKLLDLVTPDEGYCK